ncbi:MAG: dihydropteroate synthase [Candidatus Nanohaloarchaea archaeon]
MELPDRTAVMGVLNVTPDSFYDGGRYDDVDDAVARAEQMVEQGADIVDVGGESTRPGGDPLPVEEELGRVRPVLERLDLDVPVSIDTRKPAVAEAALDLGADIVNDVTGLGDAAMRELVADRGCDAVIMDAVNIPVDPDAASPYDDVVADVKQRLQENVEQARAAGVADDQIIVDPGFGFGKGYDGDRAILQNIDAFTDLDYPVIFGCSRKSFFGHEFGLEKENRLEVSVAANVLAAYHGVNVVRVHDVKETVRALKVADMLR